MDTRGPTASSVMREMASSIDTHINEIKKQISSMKTHETQNLSGSME
jgi:hypothetical protein